MCQINRFTQIIKLHDFSVVIAVIYIVKKSCIVGYFCVRFIYNVLLCLFLNIPLSIQMRLY